MKPTFAIWLQPVEESHCVRQSLERMKHNLPPHPQQPLAISYRGWEIIQPHIHTFLNTTNFILSLVVDLLKSLLPNIHFLTHLVFLTTPNQLLQQCQHHHRAAICYARWMGQTTKVSQNSLGYLYVSPDVF